MTWTITPILPEPSDELGLAPRLWVGLAGVAVVAYAGWRAWRRFRWAEERTGG